LYGIPWLDFILLTSVITEEWWLQQDGLFQWSVLLLGVCLIILDKNNPYKHYENPNTTCNNATFGRQ
jgi:hypothetical protein